MTTRTARLTTAAMALALAGGLCTTGTAGAAIVTPVAANSATGSLSSRPIEKTIDGSGLIDVNVTPSDILDDEHQDAGSNSGPYWIGLVSGAELTFTLAEPSTVDTVHLWKYNRAGEGDRAIQSFDISFSTNGGINYGPTISVTGFTVGESVSVNSTVESQSFATQSGVTHIKLTNIVNHGDTTYVGLGEIRFGETVPEPGSLALLGLGGLFVARRRRSA